MEAAVCWGQITSVPAAPVWGVGEETGARRALSLTVKPAHKSWISALSVRRVMKYSLGHVVSEHRERGADYPCAQLVLT